ncbi:MAG TPA: hypothetical protein VGE72_29185 [Azospirillum sp.]
MAFLARERLRLRRRYSALPTQLLLGHTKLGIAYFSRPFHRRLLEPIGNIPPAEAEARYYAHTEDIAMAA